MKLAKHPAISSDVDVREYFREKVAHLRHSKKMQWGTIGKAQSKSIVWQQSEA
jgi:hypothetical protein